MVGFGWGRGCEREGGGDGLRGLGSVLSETMGWAGKRVKEGRLSWIFFARFPRYCGGVAGPWVYVTGRGNGDACCGHVRTQEGWWTDWMSEEVLIFH